MQRDESVDPTNFGEGWCDVAVPEQTPSDMLKCMQLSRSWHAFYSTPLVWKKALESHFGIARSVLNIFEGIVFNIAQIENIDYRLIYHRWLRLQKSKDSYYDFAGVILKNPERHLALLVCCLDNVEVARKVLPRSHEDIWRKAVMSADCVNIFTEMLTPQNDDYIYTALSVRADKIVQHYLETKLPFISNRLDFLRKGSLSHVQYMLANQSLSDDFQFNGVFFAALVDNPRIPLSYTFEVFSRTARQADFSLRLTYDILYLMLCRKDEAVDVVNEFIQFLWDNKISFDNCIQITPIVSDLIIAGYLDYAKYLLRANQVISPMREYFISALVNVNALSSGNLQFFFDPANPWALPQSEYYLEDIILGGYEEVAISLLDPANGYQFKLTSKIFEIAAGVNSPQFLRYLLSPQTPSSCKPQPWALSLALRSGKPENASVLLEPAFELKPTQDNLSEAVNNNQFDIVTLLMSEERQYGLTFTLAMLKTACEPRTYLGRYHEPDLRLIQFMLQPRFGLHVLVDQEFFDSLYTSPHNRKEYCSYNKIDVILFFLDHYRVRLTQDKFEQLYDRHLLAIIDLLDGVRFPDRFSYLSFSSNMLRVAFCFKNQSYVEGFLQPVFGLQVDYKVLGSAIYNGMEELAERLQLNHGLVPREREIINLLDSGNVKYARRLLARHTIPMGSWLIDSLLRFSLESMAFALELARTSGLLDYNNPKSFRVPGMSLERNELLLDPQNHCHFFDSTHFVADERKEVDFVFKSVPSIEYLIKADIAVRVAISARNHAVMLCEFEKALQLSPSQCFRVAAYAVAHPDEFRLNEEAQAQLLNLMVNATSTLNKFSIVDLMQIKKYFIAARTVLVEHKKHELAAQLPIAEITTFLTDVTTRSGYETKKHLM